MIWIYEDIVKSDLKSLAKLNPLMDYSNDGTAHINRTFCAGWEIKDGIYQEIRKIRFFDVCHTKQGFICDEVFEAQELCRLIRGEKVKNLVEKYPTIKKYIKNRSSDPWINYIAIPVRSFIGYAVENHKSLLDGFDVDLLKKSSINIHEFIPIKHFHSGETLMPDEIAKPI